MINQYLLNQDKYLKSMMNGILKKTDYEEIKIQDASDSVCLDQYVEIKYKPEIQMSSCIYIQDNSIKAQLFNINIQEYY